MKDKLSEMTTSQGQILNNSRITSDSLYSLADNESTDKSKAPRVTSGTLFPQMP